MFLKYDDSLPEYEGCIYKMDIKQGKYYPAYKRGKQN
jgi:hypothetical protein